MMRFLRLYSAFMIGFFTLLVFMIVVVQAFAPSSAQLSYIGEDGNIYLTDMRRDLTFNLSRQFVMGESRYQFDISWSPDGRWLAFESMETNHLLYVVNMQSGNIQRFEIDHSALIWSPDRQFFALDQRNTMRVFRLDSHRHWLEITNTLDLPLNYRVSEVDIALMDNLDDALRTFITYLYSDNPETISTNSEWVTYDEENPTNANRNLFVRNLRTEEIRPITFEEGIYFLFSAFSPDGTQIAFVVPESDHCLLSVYDIVHQSNACFTTPYISGIEWSPDGNSIAFTTYNSLYIGNIYVLNLATGAYQPIADNVRSGYQQARMVWSPDRNFIAYEGAHGLYGGLFVVSRDGRLHRQINIAISQTWSLEEVSAWRP